MKIDHGLRRAILSAPPLPAVQRYFEVSLFLLVATGILAVVSDRQARHFFDRDSPSSLLVYKGIRLWRGRGPELSVARRHRAGPGLFPIFPVRSVGAFARACAKARRTPRFTPRCSPRST